MTKHIYIDEYGTFLGKTSARLSIYNKNELIKEIPFSRIKTINILKKGVSFSSDLVQVCANYGIKIFFLDFKGVAVCGLYGTNAHAVSNVRRAQFLTIESDYAKIIAKAIIISKLKNQRATLLYFLKYLKKTSHQIVILQQSEITIKGIITSLKKKDLSEVKEWRSYILGKEGSAASSYFYAIKKELLPHRDFNARVSRGAPDIVNQALNYGYAILTSFIWQSIINAGLEPYAGVLHTQRAGKPSLVLDIMEEYRAWVVDRNIIKLRSHFEGKVELDTNIKKKIIKEVNDTMQKRHLYNKKRLTLESIMQRQVYKLVGCFMQQNHYRGYTFKW